LDTVYDENKFGELDESKFVSEFIDELQELQEGIENQMLQVDEYEEENREVKCKKPESKLGKCPHPHPHPHPKHETPLEANCRSEIHIKPKNKIIYVCEGGAQYFLVESSKCCKEIHTEFLGCRFNKKYNKIYGNLGVYYILSSGILFIPKKNLRPGEIDILPFKAFDDCNHYKFDVVFTFDPCKCCKK